MPLYLIDDLVKQLNITKDLILHYEEEGLLNPQQSPVGRLYSASDALRLRLIIKGTSLGFDLAEMKTIIFHDAADER